LTVSLSAEALIPVALPVLVLISVLTTSPGTLTSEAPLSTTISNVIAPFISTGTTKIPFSFLSSTIVRVDRAGVEGEPLRSSIGPASLWSIFDAGSRVVARPVLLPLVASGFGSNTASNLVISLQSIFVLKNT
jgi:hypothetical protein